jgi:hypothetical protein
MLNSNAENITIHGALTHGLAIFVLISVFGHIRLMKFKFELASELLSNNICFSGGHFNPAVTLSVALAERLSWPLAIIYWIAQFLGGFSGAFLVRVVYNNYDLYM